MASQPPRTDGTSPDSSRSGDDVAEAIEVAERGSAVEEAHDRGTEASSGEAPVERSAGDPEMTGPRRRASGRRGRCGRGSRMSRHWQPRSTTSTTWPTRAWRRRCSSPSGCPSRSCWRASPASARRRRPRRWHECSTPRCSGCRAAGIDAAEALYEWNHPRQLLGIRPAEARQNPLAEEDLFGRDYLLRRPLLQTIEHAGPRPAVLLLDEIDRADAGFEAFTFEVLAEAAVTVPEIGTIRATHPPVVVLTSNRTRDLNDALTRRCLYHWIDYPQPGGSPRSSAGGCRARRAARPGLRLGSHLPAAEQVGVPPHSATRPGHQATENRR